MECSLVDDASYQEKTFDFDQYSEWLRSQGFKPDLVARESQIVRACDALLGQLDYAKLSNKVAKELHETKYTSQLFIAAWCLLRLGYLEDQSFDLSLRADKLVNILPESFKAGEDESLEIIGASPYAEAVTRIDYIFLPEQYTENK